MRIKNFIWWKNLYKIKSIFSQTSFTKSTRFSWVNLALCHLTCLGVKGLRIQRLGGKSDSWGIRPWDYQRQIQFAIRAGLEPRSPALKSDALYTLFMFHFLSQMCRRQFCRCKMAAGNDCKKILRCFMLKALCMRRCKCHMRPRRYGPRLKLKLKRKLIMRTKVRWHYCFGFPYGELWRGFKLPRVKLTVNVL